MEVITRGQGLHFDNFIFLITDEDQVMSHRDTVVIEIEQESQNPESRASALSQLDILKVIVSFLGPDDY